MLNLIRFLYKHAFIVYFILLEIICFILLLQSNPYQRASFLNSSDFMVSRTYAMFDDVKEYLNLGEVNEYLSEENSELRNNSLEYYRKTFDGNVVYLDSSYEQEFVFFPSKVIRNSANKRNNYLTLDKGTLNGVETGMGVVSKNGVVGIVIETSNRFSAVMSVLNKESKISAKIQKSGYFGSVVWPGDSYRMGKLLDIPNHVSLLEGDLIITSGFSGIYPEGIPIGRVKTVERLAGSGFLEVEIEFTEDYRNLSFVHVVKYLHKMERKDLESQLPLNE